MGTRIDLMMFVVTIKTQFHQMEKE